MAKIDLIIPHTLKWEGGLSRATTDSASKNPSPYIYKNVYGWHTNRGITYQTFSEGSKLLGYENNLNNFIFMPDYVWLKIAKKMFWDPLKLDDLQSQALANLFFSWSWAGGSGYKHRTNVYLRSKGIAWNYKDPSTLAEALNTLIKKVGEKRAFNDLLNQYKEFYLGMPESSNPKTEAHPEGVYTKGWLNRLDDLKNFSSTFIGKTVLGAGGLIFLGLVGFFLYRKFK